MKVHLSKLFLQGIPCYYQSLSSHRDTLQIQRQFSCLIFFHLVHIKNDFACPLFIDGQFHRCHMGQSEVNFVLKYVSNIDEHFLIVIFGPSIVT